MTMFKTMSLCLVCTWAVNNIPPAHAQNEEAYRLRANDKISLSVYREADLDTKVSLSVSGEASFPLINAVQLGGLTLREAEEKLTRLYEADFLVETKLSLNLEEAALETVSVIGAVAVPGDVAIPRGGQLDLRGVLAAAGGLSPVADRSQITLSRRDQRVVYSMDKLELKGVKPVLVVAGDRIMVGTNRFAGQAVMVTGEVAKSGPVSFPINGNLDLATLIGLAGGVSEKGDKTKIIVTRGKKRFVANLNGDGRNPILLGDIVFVPLSPFVGKFVTVMGQVKRPGPIPFPLNGKLTALQAVVAAGDFSNLAQEKKVFLTRRGTRITLNLKDVKEGKKPSVALEPGDTLSVAIRFF
jgi:polysaccharide export outer membrane protein